MTKADRAHSPALPGKRERRPATERTPEMYIEKRDLTSACVGSGRNGPLGFISLTENLMMIAMDVWMLARGLCERVHAHCPACMRIAPQPCKMPHLKGPT